VGAYCWFWSGLLRVGGSGKGKIMSVYMHKPMLKKLLPILVCVVMAIGLIGTSAITANADGPGYDKKAGDWGYLKIKGGLQLVWLGTKSTVKVPNTLVGKKVLVVYVFTPNVKKVDTSAAKSLKTIGISSGKLKTVNFTKNTKLEQVSLYTDQKISKLSFAKNKKLKMLSVVGSKIKKLDISKNTKLTFLDLGSTAISKLDASKCKALTNLSLYKVKLKSLNVSKNKKLKALSITETPIKKLSIAKSTKLEYLTLKGTKLTSLNITKNKKLKSIYIQESPLTSLKLPATSNVETLSVLNNKLKSLDISKLTKLQNLDISFNAGLSVDVKTCKSTIKYIAYSEGKDTKSIYFDSNYDWATNGTIYKNT
jgi:hypothetical protein